MLRLKCLLWKGERAILIQVFGKKKKKKAVKQLLIVVETSASVERLFSTYGLVHSKLRKQLDIEKAATLVFLYKALNSVS